MRSIVKQILELTENEVIVKKIYDDGFEKEIKVINILADKAEEFFMALDFELTNKGEIGDDYQRKMYIVLNAVKHLMGEATYISLLTPDAISYMKLLAVLEREIELTWTQLGDDGL